MHDTRRAGRQDRHHLRSVGRPVRAWPALAGRTDFLAVAGYLAAVMLFGGGLAEWSAAYAVLTLATVVAAALLAWRAGSAAFAGVPAAGRVGLAAIVAVPLLQLIPLPPPVWHALPGEDLRRGSLALAGLADSWQPLTIEPVGTALAAVLAVGFVVLVGLLLRLTDAQFRRTLQIAVALVLAGMVVGLLQVVSDGHPQLQVSNMGATMLGFFANKNHMALAVACSIVIVGLIAARDLFGRDRHRALTVGYLVFALVCIVTTNSRAGLALGVLAGIVVLAQLARGIALRWRVAALVGAVVIAAVVASSSAFETVSGRVGDIDADLRWSFTVWSWPLVRQYWASGSGLGSFATLFAAHEQLAWVKPTRVNAVHDDYIQLVIEAGIPGVLGLAALAAGVVGAIPAWLAKPAHDPRRSEMAMGFAIVLLFALHSALDYPLRRPSAWALLALALAAVFRGSDRAALSRLPGGAARNDPA